MTASAFQKHHRNSVHDYVALDIETIDVRPTTKILSIGVVRVRDGRSVRELELFPAGWEQYEIPYGHPTDRALLADMHRQSKIQNMHIAEVLRELADFMGDDVIVGQNIARFDLPVISNWAERHSLPAMNNHYVDLLPLARKTYPQLPNHKLETLTRHHRLGTVAHTALSDAVQEHQLYERMKADMAQVSASAPVIVNPNWRKRTPIADVIDSVTEVKESTLSGKRICVTGEFPNRTRESIWAELTGLGIVPLANITAKTDYLLVGAWGAGPVKLATALERGIEVLTWQRLQDLLAAPSTTSQPAAPTLVEQAEPFVETLIASSSANSTSTSATTVSTIAPSQMRAVVDPEWSNVVAENALVGDLIEHNSQLGTIRRRGMIEHSEAFYYSLKEFSVATGGRQGSVDEFVIHHGEERWTLAEED